MRNLLDTLNGDLKYSGKQPVAIPTAVDGRFVNFPSTSSPPLTNPAVARTEAWRQALREAKNRLGDKGMFLIFFYYHVLWSELYGEAHICCSIN